MAGTTLKIRGAQFSKVAFNLRLPFVNGLIGEYVFGNNDTQSIRNLANPSVPATVVGTVTYGTDFAVIKSATVDQGFNLNYPFPNSDVSIICVPQVVSGCPVWCSSFVTTINGFHNASSVPMLFNASTGTAANQANMALPAHGNYSVFVGTMPLGAKQRIYAWTAAVRSMDEAENNGGSSRVTAAVTARVGTTIANSGSGTANMAYVAIFNRILTDAEINAVYPSLKNFYSGKIVIS